MNDDTTTPATQNPERKPAESRLRSATLQADVIRVAEQVAQTQDRLAESLRRMAIQHPQEASRLRASISAAENHATWTRHLAHDLRVGSKQGDDIRPDIPAAALAPVSHTGRAS